MQLSIDVGKISSPLFSAALQNRFTACIVSPQLHLWKFALHTGVQSPSTNAVENLMKAAWCHCLYTYGDLVFIQVYMQHQCTAALVRAT